MIDNYSTVPVMKKVLSFVICIVLILAVCSCEAKPDVVPVIRHEDNKIYLNGKYITTSESLTVYRLDANAVSLITSSGETFNLDAQGNEISLSDIITDRLRYELSLGSKMNGVKMRPIIRSSVRNYEFDYDAMQEALSSYDYAMKLPYYMLDGNVHIIYTDPSDHSESVAYSFNVDGLNPKYAPSGGISCSRWMTGRLGYGIKGLKREEHDDHWVESSLEIKNYNGKTYYWFCVRYEDDGVDSYYSTIAVKEGDSRDVIYSKPVDGRFCCCDIEEFEECCGRA